MNMGGIVLPTDIASLSTSSIFITQKPIRLSTWHDMGAGIVHLLTDIKLTAHTHLPRPTTKKNCQLDHTRTLYKLDHTRTCTSWMNIHAHIHHLSSVVFESSRFSLESSSLALYSTFICIIVSDETPVIP